MTIESKLGILGKGRSESSNEDGGYLPHSPVKLGLWIKNQPPIESCREIRVHRRELSFIGVKKVKGLGFCCYGAMDFRE